MRMNRQKRLLVSVGMGAGLPIAYLLLLMLVGKIRRSFDVGYRHWFEYLTFPITWAGEIYARFLGFRDHPGLYFFRRDYWLATIIGDLVLYTFLVYIYLRRREATRLE